MTKSWRIARFIDEVRVDPGAAEVQLHKDIVAAHGPLIESIPHSDNVLVTFVCIRDADALSLRTPLAVLAATVNLDLDVELERVPGTRVWHTSIEVDPRIATSYQYRVPGEVAGKDLETEYELQHDAPALANFAHSMVTRGFADPVNPNRLFPTYGVVGGMQPAEMLIDSWESILELPQSESFPHLDFAPERGVVTEHTFSSVGLPGERTVAVYVPPRYNPSVRYPLVLCFDGEHYRDVGRMPEILDHAISAGRLPPLIAVFWHNRDAASRTSELTCNPGLEVAIAEELWPWLDENYSISHDPNERVVTGFSLGGLASLWVGLTRPDVFGSVLAVSPSLWFSGDNGREASGWLTREYDRAGSLPTKVFVAVGSLEVGGLERAGSNSTMVELARELRDVLSLKAGVESHYREEQAGHDYINVRRSSVAGLVALLGSP